MYSFLAIQTSRRTRHGFFWEQASVDLPLQGMNPSACKFFNCGLRENVRRTYTAVIPLKRTLPTVRIDSYTEMEL